MSTLFPPLAKASAQILAGFTDSKQPIFKPNDKELTLRTLLNQTSGFGMEFGEVVPRWKEVTDKGKGFVNSCKVVSGSFGSNL
jgi:methyl acetate hydrolase